MGETDASRREEEIVMTSLINNIRYGLRQIRRSPGFAATVILTMALGVGANVVVFSVLNALVLKPMDLPGFEQLMFVGRHANANDTSPSQSYPDYRDLQRGNLKRMSIPRRQIHARRSGCAPSENPQSFPPPPHSASPAET
jgi:hypothetical protein